VQKKNTKMKLKLYIQEAFNELLYKVSWPAWSELQSSALVVMISSLIVAVVIFVIDLGFQNLIGLIYKMFF